MTLLLDTCALLWLAAEPKKLSAAAASKINESPSELSLSEASILEIVLKYSAGKLPLPEAPRLWIPKQLSFFQVTAIALSSETLYLAGELPKIHADPFDRLIAAESIARGFSILTPDTSIAALGAKCIW